jgi:hypothetical protein
MYVASLHPSFHATEFENGEGPHKVDVHHLYLPSSIFFLSAFCPWYMNESMMPETVNTPEDHADRKLVAFISKHIEILVKTILSRIIQNCN